MKLSILYLALFLFIYTACNAQSATCPEANKHTKKMLKKVLKEDKNNTLRKESGIKGLKMQDLQVLHHSSDSTVCKTLKEDGYYYPENPDMPTTLTYFKSDNFYFVVVHFSDTILKKEEGKITGSSGPPGAVKIYDKNFNAVGHQIIW